MQDLKLFGPRWGSCETPKLVYLLAQLEQRKTIPPRNNVKPSFFFIDNLMKSRIYFRLPYEKNSKLDKCLDKLKRKLALVKLKPKGVIRKLSLQPLCLRFYSHFIKKPWKIPHLLAPPWPAPCLTSTSFLLLPHFLCL